MVAKPLVLPFSMDDAVLTLGADDYTEAITDVALVPTASTPVKGVGGNQVQGRATWSLNGSLMQDADPAGLQRYLFDNEGNTVAFSLTPTDGGTPWTGQVVLSPTAIGGARSDQVVTTSFSLPINGRPVPGTPAP